MNTVIFSTVPEKGVNAIYMLHGGEKYWLFNQNYRKSVQNYYKDGVRLNDAMDFARAKNSEALMHTMTKLPIYIKYVEKLEGIAVLEQTKQKLYAPRWEARSA